MTSEPDLTGAAPLPSGVTLAGWRILVTRALHQASSLAEPLAALGADVVVAPVIDTAEPLDWGPADEAIRRLGGYTWIVLTSANAVERFLNRMGERGVPATELSCGKIAVVGSATAARLREFGIEPALVPDDYRAEGLRDAFIEMGAGPGWRFLIPRALRAREILPDALRSAGAEVDVVPVYRTVPARPDPAVVELLRGDLVDVITFTSPSTVAHFVSWAEAASLDPAQVLKRAAAASIGPVTTDALRARGFSVPIQADPYTALGLVEAILAHAVGR